MKNGRKLYFMLLLVVVFLMSTMLFSYAFFSSKNEHSGKLNIVVGNLSYKLESNDLENNRITVKAHKIKEITISLNSLNDVDSKYELFYTTENSDVFVGYSADTVDSISGIINANSTKEITVVIRNDGNTDAVVSFGVIGGLKNNELVLNVGKSLNQEVTTSTVFKDVILTHNKLVDKEPTLTTTSLESGDKSGLYKSTATNSGDPTYYFRGSVENNYVEFAGFTWRIVRINEDGTVRLIMQDGINDNALYKFNSVKSSKDYMYYSNSDTTKPTLETWYQENIVAKGYFDNIVTGDYFCEQAKVAYASNWVTDSGASMTMYDKYNPDYKCTVDGNGKGLVNASIGLLNYDEIVYAGGYHNKINDSYYLRNSGVYWWTMSPAGFGDSAAFGWRLYASGGLIYVSVDDSLHLRPVINLKSDTIASGTGTSTNPYVIGEKLRDLILDGNDLIEAEPTLTDSSNNTSDASGLYKSTATNSGDPTYYFRGNVENNYVEFAGFTWRVVRINEDGTVRLVMQDGISDNTEFQFNSVRTSKDNMYYSNSNVGKLTLETWYTENIINKGYSDSVVKGKYYCEQAKVAYDSTYATNSGADMDVYTNYIPDFKCSTDDNGKGIVNGNIGLLNYDEIIHAGGYGYKENNQYYLYNSINSWWTMSPAGFSGTVAYNWNVHNNGFLDYSFVSATNILRPVINLKVDIVVSGLGTSSQPYKIIY